MGVWDDWKAKFLAKAAADTAKRAASSVTDRISAFGEEFLSDAEGQLAEAEQRHGERDPLPEVDVDVEMPDVPDVPVAPMPDPEASLGHARRAREAREDSAKGELARMKAELRAKIQAREPDD